MLIDWFTVVAQIVNFLILVALLKRFLYRPILKVINEREQKIASQLEQASQKKQEAEREADAYRHKVNELHQSRQQMFDQVQAEVEAWRQEQLSEVHAEVDGTQRRLYEAIRQEREALLSQLRQRAAEQVVAIARRALADLASVELEKQIAASFIDRVQNMDEGLFADLNEAIQVSGQEITVSSTFELPQEVHLKIKETLDEQIGNGRQLNFETSRDIICGIELKVPGYKISWSLDSYLDALEEKISEIFQERVLEG